MLVVYAGSPKAGDMQHAAEMFGAVADTVDLLEGGRHHDITVPRVFEGLLRRVESRAYQVVWLAPPCSSFSVLHL